MRKKNSVGFWEQRSEWCFRTAKPLCVPSVQSGLRYMRQCQNMRKISAMNAGQTCGGDDDEDRAKDGERVLESYPFELSGGMNQRVGICTAMISIHHFFWQMNLPARWM